MLHKGAKISKLCARCLETQLVKNFQGFHIIVTTLDILVLSTHTKWLSLSKQEKLVCIYRVNLNVDRRGEEVKMKIGGYKWGN